MNNSYKILKNKIQIRNEKMIVVDDMIDDMFSNKEIIQQKYNYLSEEEN